MSQPDVTAASRLLEIAFSAEDAEGAGPALRRLRATSESEHDALLEAAGEAVVLKRLGFARRELAAAALDRLPAGIASRLRRVEGAPDSVRFTSPAVAHLAARAAALGAGVRTRRPASDSAERLGCRLLALDREAFRETARLLGYRELRWMCGTIDRRSAVRLLARLGPGGPSPTRPASSWEGDLDDACRRLAAIDLAAAGCDVAMLLGCSVLLTLADGCAGDVAAALRSRMPLAVPSPASVDLGVAEAAVANALLEVLEKL